MKFQLMQGVRSRFWYPVIHRFPSGAKELAWWRIRITWNDPWAVRLMEPINRQHELIQSGIYFGPKIKPHCIVTTDICPLVRDDEYKGDLKLAGRRFGRFIVLGLSVEFRGRWVCRCDCGNYEFRTAKAIRNPANHIDRCHPCRKAYFIMHGYSK
jgi:hypothetical protein